MENTRTYMGIDIDAMHYMPLSVNKSGGKQVNVTTVKDGDVWADRFRFQLSVDISDKRISPFGLSPPFSNDANPNRRTLCLNLDNAELLTFFENLDKHNVKMATENSVPWFKKQLDEATIRAMYVSCVKPSDIDGKPPLLKVKVKCPTPENNKCTSIFNVNKEEGDKISANPCGVESLQSNCPMLIVVETPGMWFMSRQFGMSLTCTEIMVWKQKKRTGIDSFNFGGSNVKIDLCNTECMPAEDEDDDDDCSKRPKLDTTIE